MSEKENSKQKSLSEVNSAPVTFNLFDPEQFATMQRVSRMYASSDLVPDNYRITSPESEPKAIGNCMIAMDIAIRIGASPLMVMQNMVPIYGRPSWSSKFLIATINACGRYRPLKYRIENLGKVGLVEYTEYDSTWETNPTTGKKYKKNTARQAKFDGSNIDNIQCIAYTTEKGSDKVLESSPVDLVMAIKEGWYTKAGSKWQTMPLKMLKYRAASFWANEYAPELSMGINTIEESEDIATEDGEAEVLGTKINEPSRTKVGVSTESSSTEGPVTPTPAQDAPQKESQPEDDDPGY